MPYFEDLTEFSYHDRAGSRGAINVGWLSKSYEFSVGEVDTLAAQIIRKLTQTPVNKFRGIHYCELCPPPIKKKKDGFISYETIRHCPYGNGEIHVLGENGIIYIAPALVSHYIDQHNYQPPREFIDAVKLIAKS